MSLQLLLGGAKLLIPPHACCGAVGERFVGELLGDVAGMVAPVSSGPVVLPPDQYMSSSAWRRMAVGALDYSPCLNLGEPAKIVGEVPSEVVSFWWILTRVPVGGDDHAGIFPGMISHPRPDAVVSELGDKVVDAIVHAVKAAKEKFAVYREQHPDWAADNAARTIADLIHDWMWTDLRQELDLLPHVNLIDQDPRREIAVRVQSPDRLSYLLRIKLHHLDGRTSSYQTQTVMDFELQGENDTFPGWGEVRLEAGYEWDKETRTIGEPVISLRHGRNRIVWVHQLSAPASSAAGTVLRPTSTPPTLPTVEVRDQDVIRDTRTEKT
jgi:hypothetical protein